jgi:RNA polymerase sigma-70 factor (ECF subfamily)
MPRRAGRGRFPATRWSLVLETLKDGSPAADEALARLYETYRYPLYAFLRGRGHSVEEAQDLTQAFFAFLLEKRLLHHADPQRGRLRSFLLTALKNFTANEHARQKAVIRGGRAVVLSLDADAAEQRYRLEPATDETPDKVFDRQWALTLLEGVMARLRSEAAAGGKDKQYELIKMYLVGEREESSYAEAAAALEMTEGAVKTAVSRLRGRFGDLVWDEVAQTVDSVEAVEDEIRHLMNSVRR